ncbi:putative mitochondrial protein [Vitis vinifera]|uniref:Putative mitochondrial protein n=1 Tax=Vitis vinifera TaxID=29760 RepID=A0A438DN40_VITVI|nr:putative mitochondrial protein [Vitis vinifera]
MLTRSKTGYLKLRLFLAPKTIEPHTYRHIVGYKYVFKLKHKLGSCIDRYKAWLVPKGFHQTQGNDPSQVLAFLKYLQTTFTLRNLGCINYFLGIEHRGALQYVTITKPDISYAVNKACQFMAHPTTIHWMAFKRILRYLKGIPSLSLIFHPSTSLDIQAYTDADWASCLGDRRSTTGHCIFLGTNLVSWSSTKQRTISCSSSESEYRALVATVAEITWIQFVLENYVFLPYLHH